MSTEYEFRATVKKVDERFQTVVQRAEEYGEAKSEGKAADATEQVSMGWWVSLAEWPIAIRFGKLKPDIEPGDIMCIVMRKIPAAPAATTPEKSP